MSAAKPVDHNEVIDLIPGRKVPAVVNIVGGLCVLLGIVGFVFGLATDPAWAWGALIVGVVYSLGLGMGAVMFSVIATITWARWSRPLKRIAEAFGFFLPITWLALVVLVVGGVTVYPWHPHTIAPTGPVSLEPHSTAVLFASKPVWLSPGFFIARQILGVGFMILLALVYLRASLRPDLIMAKARLGDRAPAWWSTVIGRGTDLDAEVRSGQSTQSTLAPIIAAVYAIVMSLVAFDLIMSLSPWWYSNMFGGWIFASSFWLAMQAIGVFTLVGLDWLGLRGWVQPKTTHDLGKLILAFTMAWAYMLYAQVLPIWYANMPEETDFLLVRMMLPEWAWLTRTVAVLCFLMPFTVLLSRGIKKMRWPFVALLATMMIGVFLERTVLTLPSIHTGDAFPWVSFLVISVGIWLGFLGATFTFAAHFLARVPVLVVSDPKLGDHPWDVHVHSLDTTHAGEHVKAH